MKQIDTVLSNNWFLYIRFTVFLLYIVIHCSGIIMASSCLTKHYAGVFWLITQFTNSNVTSKTHVVATRGRTGSGPLLALVLRKLLLCCFAFSKKSSKATDEFEAAARTSRSCGGGLSRGWLSCRRGWLLPLRVVSRLLESVEPPRPPRLLPPSPSPLGK